ncbi:MAG: fructosamine kinase family protein [Bacteroidota bacterium]
MEEFINAILFRTFGKDSAVKSYKSVGGGCINNGLVVVCDERDTPVKYFIKWNEDQIEDLFEKEALGLSILGARSNFTIPTVLGHGSYGTRNFLILEYIESGHANQDFWTSFGEQLADMHRVSHQQYGLDHPNYIGKLPQANHEQSNWIDFFISNRLEPQLGMAVYHNRISSAFAKKFKYLYSQLPGILTNEPPALLHGDLWSGNFMVNHNGRACLIDPAVYYGHREIEIAFTQLFGGFDNRFYQSYQESYPLEPDFSTRAEIYNLYPLLVHVNLFGESYLSGIERAIRKYC